MGDSDSEKSGWVEVTDNNTSTEPYEPWSINCPYEDCNGNVYAEGGWTIDDYQCLKCNRKVEFAVRAVNE